MIVCDLHDRDCRDALNVDSAVVQEGDRVVIWRKDEPLAIIEIDRVLPFTITCKLMSPVGWRMGNGCKCRRVRKNGEPHHDCSSPALSVRPLKEAPGIKCLFELSGFEGDYHRYAEGNDLGEGVSRRD